MSDLVGQKLGQYEISSLIGRGGMATVYLAQQPSMSRTVAVKVLPPQLLHDETFLKRFRREVQAIARLQHPRIIPVYDYGEERDIPYIVMAYIDGGSLAERIKERGGLPLDETQRLIAQIAEGLDYAHHIGIIHRDFKPSNVLLDAGGNAYLSDFGIAKVSQETMQLTGSGIVGTPAYMAPEMFKQEDATPAIDIYALGVTLYQMLSGDAPFAGTTPVQLMYAHLNEPIPAITAVRPDMPPQVQAVIDRAMAKNPSARYPTAAALAEELALAARGELPLMDEHTQPLNDLPRVATGTAPSNPTPHIVDGVGGGGPTPDTPPITPPAPVIPPAPGGKRVNELMDLAAKAEALDRGMQEDRKAAREREKAEKRARHEEWKRDHPRKGGFPWWLLLIGFGVFLLVCNGASMIGGAVGAALSSIDPPDANSTPVRGTMEQALNSATTLEVDISVGAGSLTIDGGGGSDTAVTGDYYGHGDVRFDQSYKVTNGNGVLEIYQTGQNTDNMTYLEEFNLTLTDSVPIDLTVSAGAGETTLDLTDVLLSALSVKAGLGKFTITLPDTGSYDVTLTAGVGETDVYIPEEVEARVDVSGGFSNVDMADKRFTSTNNNVWETPGYQDATDRVRITITSGVGKVLIDRP